MRRTLALFVLLTLAACLSACGGDSNANVTSNANGDTGTTGVPDRQSNSNMAPRGGPGTEPAN